MAWEDGDEYQYTSPGVPKREVKWYLLEDVDSRAKWFTFFIFLVSVGMLIAGSVMLGIGLSNNNKHNNPTVCTQDSGYTMFLTVQTRSLPYSSVVSDYSGSVQNLTDQMRQAIAGSASSASLETAITPNVPITILGISKAGQWADVTYALSYSNANKPSLTDIQNEVTASKNFVVVSASDQTPATLNQMTCAAVADSTVTTATTVASHTTAGTQAPITGTTPCGAVTVSTITPNPGTPNTPVTSGTPNTSVTASTLTPPTPVVTLPAKTTTTPFVKTPYSLDVIILLDDSTAMLSPENFNSAKNWITDTLLPLWLIDREDVQVAFSTYADKEFNTLLDFDEFDENEVVSVISAQVYSGKYNSSITNGIRAAGDIHGLRPVNQTVLLISASEDLTDIETATKYAYIINTLPKQLITVTLNSQTGGKQLGLLSTDQNLFFGVPDFNLTSDIAQKLTQYMFGTLTPSTLAPTTTAVPDNSCKADVTILIDNNNDVGSADEFKNQLRTISKLIKTWPISSELMEGEAVVFATEGGGKIVENPFAYQSSSAFANEVMAYDDYYFGASPPSLAASLQYLSNNLGNRRTGRQQTTIVITYSSDNSNVQSAIQFADKIGGNLIIVAIGAADQTILKQLGGNVVYALNMTTDIIDPINNLICSTATRAPLLTTTPSAKTSFTTSQNAGTSQTPLTTVTSESTTVATQVPVGTTPTPAPTTSTTPLPDPCPDCSPRTSNILLLVEAFGTPLSDQKQLISNNLIANWDHFERTSIIGFDTMTKNQDPINFGDIQDKDDFTAIVQNINAFSSEPTIVSAFNLAVNRANPLKTFGKMSSVIFTSGASDTEINSSIANSNILRANGKVIIVGMKLSSTNGLDSLCDVLLKWDDLTNLTDISNQINQALNS